MTSYYFILLEMEGWGGGGWLTPSGRRLYNEEELLKALLFVVHDD